MRSSARLKIRQRMLVVRSLYGSCRARFHPEIITPKNPQVRGIEAVAGLLRGAQLLAHTSPQIKSVVIQPER
jgi:hypothetical protein